MCRWPAYLGSPILLKAGPLRGNELVGRLMTASVRIGDWQIHYLSDGCEGPGWYTYVFGQLTLKVDNLPSRAAGCRCWRRHDSESDEKGDAAPAGGNHRSTYAATSSFGISAGAGYLVPSARPLLSLPCANWNTPLEAARLLARALPHNR
jgi:hypothetical protein